MMRFKRLLFLIVFLIPCSLVAQKNVDSYLYDSYQKKNTPQLFAAIDSIKQAKKDEIIAKIKALPPTAVIGIIKSADAALAQPWPLLTFSQFNEFKTTGNRVNFENNYFARRNKLNTLIVGELVANDGRYMNEIANGLGLICEESTWALPAHMSLQKAGNGLPDVNEPIIDLFVGQTAIILSQAKYVLGDKLSEYSPLLVRRIDRELKKRVFDPYLQRDDFWWMGFNMNRKMNNWNIFINTNVLSATILAEDDPNTRHAIIEKTIKSVDYFLKSYPADGGCDEGPSYWGIAGGALIEYIDILTIFSDQNLDFSKNELVHRIGSYIYKVHIDQNYYVNFADAAVANAQDPARIFKYGKLFNDEKLLQYAAYVRKINGGTDRFDTGSINGFLSSLELNDVFKSIKPVAPQLRQVWLKDVQILTARQQEGSAKGLFFAAKGGHNGESHNHNDVGNFIIYKDGTPLVIDAGVGVYTKQTFSSERYKLWYMQSGWHNCPTINGVMQQAGPDFKAKNIVFETKGELTKLSMDLASAYPEEAEIGTWRRSFSFNHKKGEVTLKEDYILNKVKDTTSLNFLINGKVMAEGKGRLKLTNAQGKSISLSFDPTIFDFEVEIKKIDDARLAGSWSNDLSRIVLKRKGVQLKGVHQVTFRDQ